ncbi:hydrogen uptake protein signature [Lucifera butyrica]|uniref:Hydrogen uptake protein signature n=1 Tax=Lucifera butyrica TaxID=1351585 RepID=A0A498R7D3_9FIRM|nr:HyaD/HybD family hydrogenase maturation endopeptidase [Lucifera butyrica]VBB06807.1 hydrogen uptake protein signature [Lucifera butyrica]
MLQVTILGVGNILLQDEGFGVRVVEQLSERYVFPDSVQVLDGGTLGMELVSFLLETEKLILVDAILGSGLPGSFYCYRNGAVNTYMAEKASMHGVGMQEILKVLELMEKSIPEIVVMGVQPLSLEAGTELSVPVQIQVNRVMDEVVSCLKQWQIAVDLK